MVAEDQTPADIRSAITEAVNGSEYLKQLEAEQDALTEDEIEDIPADLAAGEDDDASGDGPDAGAESETVDDGTDWEALTEYWGTSLEGLSVEQKQAVVSALEQRDSTIQQLQQRLAAKPKAPEPEVEPDPDPELSDEDILAALGIDLEDDFAVEQAKKHTLPLAKQIMALEEQVEKISQVEQGREVVSYWNSKLDELEGDYGKLPGNRVAVLQYAAEEKISDPEVLYFRLTQAGRKEVEAEVAKVRQASLRKQAQGGLRPSTSTAKGRVTPDGKDKSLRDVVKEAAIMAQRESGYKWSDLVRKGR